MSDEFNRPDSMTTGLLVCIIGLVITLPPWVFLMGFLLGAEHRGPDGLEVLGRAVGLSYLPAMVWGFVRVSRRWPSLADRYWALLGPPAIVVGAFAVLVQIDRLLGR